MAVIDYGSARRAGAARLRPEKRAAIVDGAVAVFAREGFARASIDAIAAESGVSTRTIYKHFADKSALFAAVVADSATRVAERETALIEDHLDRVADVEQLETALIGFARAWVSRAAHDDAHRALMREVAAEARHLGDQTVATWWQAGPGRVLGELAARLRRWDDEGLLSIDDAERASVQLARLVSATPGPPGSELAATRQREWVAAGVRVFVKGHRA